MASKTEMTESKVAGTQKFPPTFKEQMGSDMVDIYVGPTEEHFRAHKDILCKKIDYFDKMFNGGFAEASTSSARFPDDHVESFDILLGWVYHGSLRDLVVTVHEDGEQQFSWQDVDAYALAEKFCLPHLQDLIMSTAIRRYKESNCLPSMSEIQTAYEKTSEKSPLRKFAVQALAWAMLNASEAEWPTSSIQALLKRNDDLSIDFLALLRKSRNVGCPSNSAPCRFHCHGDDKPCIKDSKNTGK